MMKSYFQILKFLDFYTPKTELDRQFIEAFIEKNYKTPHQRRRNRPNFDDLPLDVESFTQWLESGVAALKIAKMDNRLIMLGRTWLKDTEIIATLEPDG